MSDESQPAAGSPKAKIVPPRIGDGGGATAWGWVLVVLGAVFWFASLFRWYEEPILPYADYIRDAERHAASVHLALASLAGLGLTVGGGLLAIGIPMRIAHLIELRLIDVQEAISDRSQEGVSPPEVG